MDRFNNMEVAPPNKLLPGERLWKIEVYHALWSGGLGNSSQELRRWQISGEETRQEESRGEGPVNLFGRGR